jgi:hypothetical protein
MSERDFQYQSYAAPPTAFEGPEVAASQAWKPTYPDQISPKAGLTTALMATFAFSIPVGLIPERAVAGPLGTGLVTPPAVVQYQAVSGPILVPLVVTVPDHWTPVYPDQIPPPAGLHASQQQAFTFVEFQTLPSPPLAWSPDYPDFARRDQIHASRIPSVFYTHPRNEVEIVPGGTPEAAQYPDWIPPLPGLHASQQQALAYVEAETLPAPDLSWSPAYPDQLDPLPGLDPASQQAFAEVLDPTFREEFPYWTPEYPDFPGRGAPPINVGPAFAAVYEPSLIAVVPEVIPSAAQYPDWIPAKPGLTTAEQATFAWSYVLSVEIPRIAPSAVFGGVVRPPARVQYQALSGAVTVPPVSAPELEIPRVSYPDWIAPLPGLHASRQQAFAWETGFEREEEPLEWQPEYPDGIARSEVSTIHAPSFFYTHPRDEVEVVPDWKPSIAPDQIDRVEVHASRVQFFAWDEGFEGEEEPLEWQPAYPDRLDPLVSLHASAQLAWAGVLEPTLIPEEPARTGWRPTYPDFARGPEPINVGPSVFFTFAIVETSAVPELSWESVYPDRVLGPEPLVIQRTIEPLPVVEAPILSWAPAYPDFARGAPPREPGWFVFPLAEILPLPPLTWEPEYPDFARALPPILYTQGGWFGRQEDIRGFNCLFVLNEAWIVAQADTESWTVSQADPEVWTPGKLDDEGLCT